MTPVNNAPTRILVGTPTYDGKVDAQCARSLLSAAKKRQAIWEIGQSSLLAECFNSLLATAVLTGYDYFCLLHADIIPTSPGWLEILVDEMERTGSDVMSAVVPIKDNRGLTSTSVCRATKQSPWNHRRLTMAEVHELPETFSTHDIPWSDGKALLINTGLWIADLRRPWLRKFPGFTISDKMIPQECEACTGKGCEKCGKHGFTFVVHVEPEDWFSSRWFHKQKCRVMATRKVSLRHIGGAAYVSDSVWGEWKKDLQSDMVQKELATPPVDGILEAVPNTKESK